MDKAFDNEMSKLCAKTEANFDRMMWREGLQSGFFEMQLLRDSYRYTTVVKLLICNCSCKPYQ
jgi:hypothetical protein